MFDHNNSWFLQILQTNGIIQHFVERFHEIYDVLFLYVRHEGLGDVTKSEYKDFGRNEQSKSTLLL